MLRPDHARHAKGHMTDIRALHTCVHANDSTQTNWSKFKVLEKSKSTKNDNLNE